MVISGRGRQFSDLVTQLLRMANYYLGYFVKIAESYHDALMTASHMTRVVSEALRGNVNFKYRGADHQCGVTRGKDNGNHNSGPGIRLLHYRDDWKRTRHDHGGSPQITQIKLLVLVKVLMDETKLRDDRCEGRCEGNYCMQSDLYRTGSGSADLYSCTDPYGDQYGS